MRALILLGLLAGCVAETPGQRIVHVEEERQQAGFDRIGAEALDGVDTSDFDAL